MKVLNAALVVITTVLWFGIGFASGIYTESLKHSELNEYPYTRPHKLFEHPEEAGVRCAAWAVLPYVVTICDDMGVNVRDLRAKTRGHDVEVSS